MPAVDAVTLDALPVSAEWPRLFDRGGQARLEERALASFLQRQRWFASRSRDIRRARFVDWAVLKGDVPSFLTVVSVEYTDGWTESYFVPLALAPGGFIIDGFRDDDTCDRILDLIATGGTVATPLGAMQGVAAPQSPVGGSAEGKRRWVRPGGDQSNSVAFADDTVVLKLFRRVEPTINPEHEIGRFLTAAGFARTPALGGALEYVRPGCDRGTLGIVQSAVKHQGTAWDYMTGELHHYYDRVVERSAARHLLSAARPLLSVADEVVQSAQTLGKRTAEMHVTLAQGTDAAFVPVAMDRPALQALADTMVGRLDASKDLLTRQLSSLNEACTPHARAVLFAAATLRSKIDAIRAIESGGLRIRVHGDYHLGQVLRADQDFVLLDFEGEPDRSIAERRTKQSPVKDVAGMLRSFSYAAYSALAEFTRDSPDDYQSLERWADAWQQSVADAFVTEYLATARSMIKLDGAPPELVPCDQSWATMLRAFVLDKALYELAYELNHRPDWVQIPLIGIQKHID